MYIFFCFFFFYDTATPVIYTDGHTLSLHYALPICKTECFLVPMLDDLVRESAEQGPLTGVRALMLYPLNALIASQEKRLTAWTKPLRGRSEEHTSELQSLMLISYAVFCLNKKSTKIHHKLYIKKPLNY